MLRFILSILIGIGVIILAIILLVKILSSPSKPAPQPLINYATTDTSVQLLIDGPVQADQTHQSIQITAAGNENQVQILNGYEGNVTKTQNFASNSSAYATFLRALDIAGYTRGTSGSSDYRGYCPLGNRYVFKIVNGSGQAAQNYWSTSCGGLGTFRGNSSLVITLFKAQIPDYSQITSSVNFSQ